MLKQDKSKGFALRRSLIFPLFPYKEFFVQAVLTENANKMIGKTKKSDGKFVFVMFVIGQKFNYYSLLSENFYVSGIHVS